MREDNNSEELSNLLPKTYSKSNFLIGSKYKTTLLEAKLLALSLSKIQSDGDRVYAQMKGNELKKIFNSRSNSFYEKLDEAAHGMTGRTVGMSDPEKREFHYMAVITNADYVDGVFTVKFNPELKSYITDIHDNYTKLPLKIMLSFKNVHAFRLYEVLRSRIYKEKIFTIDLAELKFLLGIANSELEGVKRYLNGQKNPDFEKALEKTPEKTYEDYNDFKKGVLSKAIKEINELTDMQVDFNPERKGRGGKVYAITFNVMIKNEKTTEQEIIQEKILKRADTLSGDEKLAFMFDLSEVIPDLSLPDYRTIATESDYDMEKIKKAVKAMKAYSSDIENKVGFLIKAMKEGYTTTEQKTQKKKKDVAKDFNNFKQTSYADIDFEKFEQEILKN